MFCGISGLFGGLRVAVPFNNLIDAVCDLREADICALSVTFFVRVVFAFGVAFFVAVVFFGLAIINSFNVPFCLHTQTIYVLPSLLQMAFSHLL
jgi:hypothetical protein